MAGSEVLTLGNCIVGMGRDEVLETNEQGRQVNNCEFQPTTAVVRRLLLLRVPFTDLINSDVQTA